MKYPVLKCVFLFAALMGVFALQGVMSPGYRAWGEGDVVIDLKQRILDKEKEIEALEREADAYRGTLEENYSEHKHPSVGVFSALALAGHSFLDGVGIGLGFQISPSIGLFVAIAVIAHDFSDGLNTVTLALINKNTAKKAFALLLVDAMAPVLGILSTKFFTLSDKFLLLYLGFFAGFLLYIGVADILPEAHSQKSSLKTIFMTILGIVFIFIITKLV